MHNATAEDWAVSDREFYKFQSDFKKWRQGDPDGDVNKWIDEKFAPVEDVAKKGTITQFLDDWFAGASTIISSAGKAIERGVPDPFDTSNIAGKKPDQYTQENIEYTAKQNNMTVEQVKEQLGIE